MGRFRARQFGLLENKASGAKDMKMHEGSHKFVRETEFLVWSSALRRAHRVNAELQTILPWAITL
jgi:hypothetical protein